MRLTIYLLVSILLLSLFLTTGPPIRASGTTLYVSDLVPVSATNGWGPVEKDKSNGDNATGDGRQLSLHSIKYNKGLGVHAPSEVHYSLVGMGCETFTAYIGVDDEAPLGTVEFTVYTDGDFRYSSGILSGNASTLTANINIANVNSLLLVVTNGGDNIDYDHADWADAQLGGCTPVATATTTRTPTATTTRTPTATPTSGWKLVFNEEFDTPAAVGQFRSVYGQRFENYPDGWGGTSGSDWHARRCSSLVTSVSSGSMQYNLHQENLPNGHSCLGGRTVNGVWTNNPAGKYWLTAVEQPATLGQAIRQTSGRYTIRFKVEGTLAGHYLVPLLWPVSEQWPRDGEIDFPEGAINSNICAFMHRQGATVGSDQDAFCTNVPFSGGWHTATTEWVSNGTTNSYVSFVLDGVEIGRSTSRIPNTPMRYVLQSETCWGPCPTDGTSARIFFDSISIYSRN